MKGAGGTSGGIGAFFIGLLMMCGGFYMLLKAIKVTSSFGFSHSLYSAGGMSLTSGMIMIPFIFGVISSINFRFTHMSAFDLIVILVLSVGGLGIFLRSLKAIDKNLPG